MHGAVHILLAHGQVWIRKEDGLKLSGLESEAKDRRELLQKFIVARYEDRFVSYVLGLRNRTAMKYALGAGGGFFRARRTTLPYVEGVARKVIRDR